MSSAFVCACVWLEIGVDERACQPRVVLYLAVCGHYRISKFDESVEGFSRCKTRKTKVRLGRHGDGRSRPSEVVVVVVVVVGEGVVIFLVYSNFEA